MDNILKIIFLLLISSTSYGAYISPQTMACTQSGTWGLSGTITLPTGAATSALQSTANAALASLDAKFPVIMSSAPVSDTGQDAIPVRIISQLGGSSSGLTDTQLRASAVPVSAAALPLPSGASTSAKQDTINTSLGTINTTLGTPFQAGGSIGNTSFGISGTLPAFGATPTFNLGTLNGAATSSKQDTGNTSLSSIDGKITAVNTGAVVVSSSALPSGASTGTKQDTGNTSLSSIDGKLTSLGQKTISTSVPIVTASDQIRVTATGTITAAQTVEINTIGMDTVTLVFTSPSDGGSIFFEYTFNGTDWHGIGGFDTSTGSGIPPASVNLDQGATTYGPYRFLVTGSSKFRVHGGGLLQTITVNLYATQGVTIFDSNLQQVFVTSNTRDGSGTEITSTLDGASQGLDTHISNTSIPVTIATAPVLVAGSAIIGKVGIDQTTPGTTNKVNIGTDGTVAIGAGSAVIGHVINDAGSAIMGKVGIDQTTPGTTNLVAIGSNNTVDLNKIAGNTTATGNGVVGTGVQRVSIASDNTPFHVIHDSGSTTAVTQATGTNLHAVLDTTSTTAVTQATGTNLHAVIDTGSTTAVTQATGTNLHMVADSGSTTAVTGNVAVTLASGATAIAKAEDVGSNDADVGVPSMAVRKATPANTSGSDGDYEFLQMSAGRLWTNSLISDGTNNMPTMDAVARAGFVKITDGTNTTTVKAASTAAAATDIAQVVVQSPNGGNPCLNPSATLLSISGSTSGTAAVQVVALSGSTKIYVCSMSIIGVSGTNPTFSLVQGTGSNCANGQSVLVNAWTTTAGQLYPFANPVAVGVAGNAVCYLDTGTTPIQRYTITYVQQ